MSHRRGRGRGSSAGRLAHLPHSMRVVEACTAAAARGAAFVRSHCRPRITEVHSIAVCAASAQSPSAALNGYNGTALFPSCRLRRKLHGPFSYVTGDAARYTLTPFRQDRAKHAGRKIPTDKPGKSRNKIFSACNAIMYEQYIILHRWAHLSGTQRPCTRLS